MSTSTPLTAAQAAYMNCVESVAAAVNEDVEPQFFGTPSQGVWAVVNGFGSSSPEYNLYGGTLGSAIQIAYEDGIAFVPTNVLAQVRKGCAGIHPDGVVDQPEVVPPKPLGREQALDECLTFAPSYLEQATLFQFDSDPTTSADGLATMVIFTHGSNSAVWRTYSELIGPFYVAASSQGIDAAKDAVDVAGVCEDAANNVG